MKRSDVAILYEIEQIVKRINLEHEASWTSTETLESNRKMYVRNFFFAKDNYEVHCFRISTSMHEGDPEYNKITINHIKYLPQHQGADIIERTKESLQKTLKEMIEKEKAFDKLIKRIDKETCETIKKYNLDRE